MTVVLAVLSAAALIGGIALIYIPAALIVGGILGLAVALTYRWPDR